MPDDDLTRERISQTRKQDDLAENGNGLVEHETFALRASAISSEIAGLTADGKPVCQYNPGETLGRYVVIRELGTGGFGHVLLCEDPKLLRKVAIKFPRLDRREFAKKNFLEEGRSVARLDHPSIVKVYDIEETEEGLPYAVMEFVDGPTLQEYINDDVAWFQIPMDQRSGVSVFQRLSNLNQQLECV